MDDPLATGWEPDLPVRDSVLRQFIFAYADRTREMAASVGGRAERDDELSLADLGSPFLFDNAAVVLRPPRDVGSLVDRASAFFPGERSWVLLCAWPTPDLSTHGLSLMGHPPLMLRPPFSGVAAEPAGLRIVPVANAADLDAFRRVLVEGYPLPAGQEGAIADPRVLGALRLFLGFAGGRAVAAAGAAVHHGVVEVDWVATLPEFRGRGFGTALTARAAAVAPELPAVLIASDDGQPVYERMGFLRLMRLTMWSRTGS
ncbi:hypothetical protein Val02_46070 [Virgisporangium aliadipatigenens]|uniref:N-acetyltransferase domain-containing protein n=1 Tax=Virgisporangium aliadipatigenens TaxID=741659 RepID=A0A8J3YPW3_9ACTN|nr:GNAT family N-acetyltransferase [Virgisporangium aliadipatigenens]GIJ47721.1 hypothetical protein Val02_46070 [Virgisporangium aliadipatigenens]